MSFERSESHHQVQRKRASTMKAEARLNIEENNFFWNVLRVSVFIFHDLFQEVFWSYFITLTYINIKWNITLFSILLLLLYVRIMIRKRKPGKNQNPKFTRKIQNFANHFNTSWSSFISLQRIHASSLKVEARLKIQGKWRNNF